MVSAREIQANLEPFQVGLSSHQAIALMQRDSAQAEHNSITNLLRVPGILARKIPETLAHPERLNLETLTCIPSGGRSPEGPPLHGGAEVHDATKRFEIEVLLKAGLPKGRVAEIAGVTLRTVHRVRAEVETRSAEPAAAGTRGPATRRPTGTTWG